MSSVELEGVNVSDYQLALNCAPEDSAQAFEVLYQRHRSRVYALCLRMTGNSPDAEDLSQEVFIQLIRKIDSFRGESAFTTWLYQITVNQVLMHFRKRSARIQEERYCAFTEEVDAVICGTPQVSVVDRLLLDRAISHLPRGKRIVLLLHDVEGYDHREIANKLGCSIGTSKSQLHKARMILRKLLLKASA